MASLDSLLFDSTNVSGCKDACGTLAGLSNRSEVVRYCRRVRSKAAGGSAAIKKRRSNIASLKAQGHGAWEAGQRDKAYSAFKQAADMQAGFDVTLLRDTIKLLNEMSKFKKALSLAYLGKYYYHVERSSYSTQIEEIYRKIGYEYLPGEIATPNGKEKCLEMDDSDLQAAMKAFIDTDFSKNLDDGIFWLIHIINHIKFRGPAVDHYLQQSDNAFLNAIQKNPSLMLLVTNCNLANCSVDKLHFVMLFLSLFRKRRNQADDALETMSPSLFQAVVANIGTSLASDEMVQRISQCSSNKLAPVFREFFMFSMPYLKSLVNCACVKESLPYPFSSLLWHCKVMTFFIFDGSTHDDDLGTRSGFAFFCTEIAEHLLEVLDNKRHAVPLLAHDDEQLNRATNLLTLVNAVAFAEWSELLLDNDYFEAELPAYTGDTLLELSSSLLFKFTKTVEKASFLLKNHAFFANLSRQLNFVSGSFVHLVEEEGRQLKSNIIIDAFLGIICSDRHVTRLEQLAELATCQNFYEPLLDSFSILLSCTCEEECDKDNAWVTILLARLCSVPRSALVSVLFSTRFLAATKKIMQLLFRFSGSYSCQAMGSIFRNIGEDLRMSFREDGTFEPLAIMLRQEIIKMTPGSNEDRWMFANALLAFNALFRPKPAIVPLSTLSVPKGSSMHRHAKLMFSKMVAAVLSFGENTTDELARLQQLIECVAAGMVLANVCESNHGFRKFWKDYSKRQTVIGAYSKAISELKIAII